MVFSENRTIVSPFSKPLLSRFFASAILRFLSSEYLRIMRAIVSKLDIGIDMEVDSHLSTLPRSSRYNTLSRSSSVSVPLWKTNSHRVVEVSSTSG
jgi:hypothetical protein